MCKVTEEEEGTQPTDMGGQLEGRCETRKAARIEQQTNISPPVGRTTETGTDNNNGMCLLVVVS